MDADRTRPAVAPRRDRQGDRLHADALASLHPLPRLSIGAQSGPRIGIQKGPLFRHWFRLVPVANGMAPRASRSAFASDGATRVGGACLPTGASRGGTAVQTRCLKRQLSFPVSMIS